MAEGGGGEIVLTDLEDGKEEVVTRKESGGRFTLGAEDGDELLGEMEFTIRHTQATPYKVCPCSVNMFIVYFKCLTGGSRHRACASLRRSAQGRCSPPRSLGWSAIRCNSSTRLMIQVLCSGPTSGWSRGNSITGSQAAEYRWDFELACLSSLI